MSNKINEAINKDNPSKITVNNRAKIIEKLLGNNLKANLGLTGRGQAVSIMRNVLIHPEILIDAGDIAAINLEPPDNYIKHTLAQIKNFFIKSTMPGGQNFKIIYDTLIFPPNGPGLKKGIIPIYMAVVLHHYKRMLVITNNNAELKITAELLSKINDCPEDYFVCCEEWSEEKAGYMTRLETIFKDYIVESEKAYNGFFYIVSAMRRWYLSLPKYVKELTVIYCGINNKEPYTPISKEQKKFINSLRQPEINAREYLFEKLLTVFSMNEFNLPILEQIEKTKQEFENSVNNLIRVLVEDVNYIFNPGTSRNANLCAIFKNWRETLNDNTLNHLFPNNENDVLNLIKTTTGDEKIFVKDLAKTVTSLSIEDWSADTIGIFINELKTIKKTIEDFDKNKAGDICETSDTYKIIFTDRTGQKTTKTFSKIPYSNKAILLSNEISAAIEEMGQAISRQEKRQILIELAEKIC